MTECKNHNVSESDEYNIARALFDDTAWMLEHEGRDNVPDVRENLKGCVANLRSMYPENVASIEGLPMPSEIPCFDYNRLDSLITDLRERYFPTQKVFEAA